MKIIIPHPTKKRKRKRVLRGWVCYKLYLEVGCVTNWYHRMVTTLFLIGLMNELCNNHIKRILKDDTLPYSLPKIRVKSLL